jgi:hypothetical protein
MTAMSYSNYRITLDVRKTVASIQLTAKKGDAGRKIYITLSDKGKPCEIADDSYAVFAGVKPDGTKLYNKTTIENNTIIYDMTQQTTAVAGLVACEVKLFDSMSNLLTSPKLTILVDDVVVPDDEIVSMDEVTALTELILDARATRELANQVIEECNAATASANTATQNATTATDNAKTATAAANAAAGRVEAAALRAETAATNAEEATEDTRAFLEDANTVLQEIRDVNVASSIVCEETGVVISLSDSSDKLLRGLKICGKTTQVTTTGKNLLSNEYDSVFGTMQGVTFADTGDGKISVSGTATDGIGFILVPYIAGRRKPIKPGTYTISGITGTGGFLAFYLYDSQEASTSITNFTVNGGGSRTFTVSADNYYGVYIYVQKDSTAKMVVAPQIEVGSVATAYEPYTGGIAAPNPDYPQALESVGSDGNIGVTVCGKNLVPKFASTTADGAVFTANDDGSVTVGGTATAQTRHHKNIYLPKGTYCLSGAPVGSASGSYDIYVICDGVVLARSYDGSTQNVFSLDKDSTFTVVLRVPAGALAQKTFYPQIEVGTTASTYEPYKDGGTLTASTPNGLPGIPVSSGGNYTDENGQQWICDEVDFARGKYVQRIGKVDFSDLEWYLEADYDMWRSGYFPGTVALTPLLCETVPYYRIGLADGQLGTNCNSPHNLWVRNGSTVNTPTGKALYQLATPIETDLSAEEMVQYSALHTNKPNTTVFNDSGAGMAVEYVADTKIYIDNKFNELAAALVNNT